MELNEFVNLHITHAITIGHQEWLVAHVLLDTLNTSASHGVVACIDNSHLPRFHIGLVNGHLILTITVIKGHIRVMQEVVGEPLLDILLLVTGADYKLSMSVIGILLHDMPEDRHTTDLNHRFWFELRFLRYAGAEASS